MSLPGERFGLGRRLDVCSPLVRRVQAFTECPAAPLTTANGFPPYPAYQLASEHLARLAQGDPSDRDDVQRHAA